MSDPQYVGVIRIPIDAPTQNDALEKARRYVRDMDFNAGDVGVEVREADAGYIELDGFNFRIRPKDPTRIPHRSSFALASDYVLELIDRDGEAHPIPENTSELTISFKGSDTVPQIKMEIDLL